jgi:hypothetical protein
MDSLRSKDFTVEKGLNVQRSNLVHWKKLLNSKSYKLLESSVVIENATGNYKTGYDVFRGQSIDTLIHNLY